MAQTKQKKILWFTYGLFPSLCQHYGLESPVNAGWLHATAHFYLKKFPDNQLTVLSVSGKLPNLEVEIDGIHFINVFNEKSILKYDVTLKPRLEAVVRKIHPDVIQIFGTEYPLIFSILIEKYLDRSIVCMQGILTAILPHYFGNIPLTTFWRFLSLRDLVKRDTPIHQYKNISYRSKFEQKALAEFKYIMGRTIWDKAHTENINPKRIYFTCNELLRPEFYQSTKWEPKFQTSPTILITQAHIPLKGFHFFIKALSILKHQFPDLRVKVAGHNVFFKKSFLLNSYARYIKNLLVKTQTAEMFDFIGLLHPKELIKEMLSASALVSPSLIENSSNSICEAQFLGLPVVASYVGGTSELIEHGKTGWLYRSDDPVMLANQIKYLLENPTMCLNVSCRAIEVAQERHSPDFVTAQLDNIYNQISGSKMPDVKQQ